MTTNVRTPLDFLNFVSCANGGAGELIHVSGILHTVVTATTSQNGGVHITSHFNSVGVSGVGETTGLRYRENGTEVQVLNANVG